MNFPAQPRNVTHLQKRFFISVRQSSRWKNLVSPSSSVPLVTKCAPTPWGKRTQESPNRSMTLLSLWRNLSFSRHQFLHGHLKDAKVYNHPWDPCGKWYWLKVHTEKVLLKVLFQVIIWFQPKSTGASLKHRVDQGMLLAWSSVSPSNNYTEAVNLPMLTPRISGIEQSP